METRLPHQYVNFIIINEKVCLQKTPNKNQNTNQDKTQENIFHRTKTLKKSVVLLDLWSSMAMNLLWKSSFTCAQYGKYDLLQSNQAEFTSISMTMCENKGGANQSNPKT